MTHQKELTELIQYWQASNLPEGLWQQAMYLHAEWMRRRSAESVDREREGRWTEVAHACKCYVETGGFVYTKASLLKEIEKLK
jgi:hypothetical protein